MPLHTIPNLTAAFVHRCETKSMNLSINHAPTGVVRYVREPVDRGAGDPRTPVQPPVVLLPPASAVETYALEELPG